MKTSWYLKFAFIGKPERFKKHLSNIFLEGCKKSSLLKLCFPVIKNRLVSSFQILLLQILF